MDDVLDKEFQRTNQKGKRRKKVLSRLQPHSSTSKVITERLDEFLKKYNDSDTEYESKSFKQSQSPFLDSELAQIYRKT